MRVPEEIIQQAVRDAFDRLGGHGRRTDFLRAAADTIAEAMNDQLRVQLASAEREIQRLNLELHFASSAGESP